MGLLQILDLFAKLVDHRLEFQPDGCDGGGVRLRTQRIRFAVEFLRQKIELAADGAAICQQRPARRHMRLQPVDLFADIGLGGQKRRFHVQPAGIEIGRRVHEQPHLFGDPAFTTQLREAVITAVTVTADKPTRKRSARDADAPTIATAAATLKSKLAAAADDPNKTWSLNDLVARGHAIFDGNCAACHQTTGAGNPALGAPALVGDKVVLGPKEHQIDVVLNGQNNGKMPPWKHLSDVDVAAVISYTRNSWGNKADQNVVQPAEVKTARK